MTTSRSVNKLYRNESPQLLRLWNNGWIEIDADSQSAIVSKQVSECLNMK